MPFDDTDLYKIIEGASYSLISNLILLSMLILIRLFQLLKQGRSPMDILQHGLPSIAAIRRLPGLNHLNPGGRMRSAVTNYITAGTYSKLLLRITWQPGKEIFWILQLKMPICWSQILVPVNYNVLPVIK